jgi:hypothetical protein
VALGENTSTFSLLLFFSAWWQARPHTRLEPEGDRLKNARCRSYNRIAVAQVAPRLEQVVPRWKEIIANATLSFPAK